MLLLHFLSLLYYSENKIREIQKVLLLSIWRVLQQCHSKNVQPFNYSSPYHQQRRENGIAGTVQEKGTTETKSMKCLYWHNWHKTYPQPSQHILTTNFTKSRGSMRHFKRYTLGQWNFFNLSNFIYKKCIYIFIRDNLLTFDDAQKSLKEANKIATDVSKFLAFSDETCFLWKHLASTEKKKRYLTELQF